ncbi:MAG: carboxymuconolactone decarboxylase family protein [Microthrixaceae bacterium]
MSEPRIPLLALDEAKAATTVAGITEITADLNVFRVLLHHPKLARSVNDLLMGLLWENQLDARLRELVIMRLGWATGSDYEWTQHWRIAGSLQVDQADLLAVRNWRDEGRFGPAERAVLAATDETLADGAITAATWRACVEHVSDRHEVLLELVAAIGAWRMISSILQSLDVPLEDGIDSWPPDGRGPR